MPTCSGGTPAWAGARSWALAPGVLGAALALLSGARVTEPQPAPSASPSAAIPAPLSVELEVPLDHSAPELGRGRIVYELGAPFEPAKPTVLVVADGQQFYLRRGAVAGLQRDWFGPAFNVVGVVGRGFSESIAGRWRASEAPDWTQVWNVLRSAQWVDDLEAVRRHLLGAEGRVLLFGQSGGGLLLHEYLAVHGRHVRRAFSACAPVRLLDARLGLQHDRFWAELQTQVPGKREALRSRLAASGEQRPLLVRLLQRQHFFVPVASLARERRLLVEEIVRGDNRALARRRQTYQVDAIEELLAQLPGPGIRVRSYEFVQPIASELDAPEAPLRPNIENEAHIARPLLAAHAAGRIPAPALDFGALHRLEDCEVFVLAGRWDQTADYRTQIALAASYPRSRLFVADDDHQFARLGSDGARERLLRAFLSHGLDSAELAAELAALEGRRWRERD